VHGFLARTTRPRAHQWGYPDFQVPTSPNLPKAIFSSEASNTLFFWRAAGTFLLAKEKAPL